MNKHILLVKPIKQIHPNACGVGALEMVYRYFGITNFSQEEIFNKYKTLEPHGSGNYMILTKDLLIDTQERGLKADMCKFFNFTSKELNFLRQIIISGIPIIVCQQFSKESPLIGHFRLVIGFEGKNIIFNDPFTGQTLIISEKEFIELWQPTGQNVTGGIFLVIRPTN
jgi:uncharacterized protein YvpB